MEINGKTAIITGGGRGIGFTIVQKLLDKGCQVGVFDKDAHLLEKLRHKYKEISCFSCDVSDPKQVEVNVESFYKDFKNWYDLIKEDFKFDYQKDCEARDYLSQIFLKKSQNWRLTDVLSLFKKKILTKSSILVFGCGPSLEKTVDIIFGIWQILAVIILFFIAVILVLAVIASGEVDYKGAYKGVLIIFLNYAIPYGFSTLSIWIGLKGLKRTIETENK